jgi:CRP/FNR family transcriptional regulator, anaerobic regulatory protein
MTGIDHPVENLADGNGVQPFWKAAGFAAKAPWDRRQMPETGDRMTNGKLDAAHTKCDGCAIRARSICRMASGKVLEELSQLSHTRTFSAGETIQQEGEPISIVGNVISGMLRILKTMADGRQQIVGFHGPADMFGRVFSSNSYFAIEAATDVTLCCFDRKQAESLLNRHGELERGLLLATLDELDVARDWMIPLGCQSVAERVASFFLIIEHRMARERKGTLSAQAVAHITVPISRRDLAAFLGTTVETISRTVQAMARNRVIEIIDSHNFRIINMARLIRMAGREEFAVTALPDNIRVPVHAHEHEHPPAPRAPSILAAYEMRVGPTAARVPPAALEKQL